ncbi:hypothetical protein [Mucilaginibacter phyllosphaerae]|uniref:DUF2157 domain-containing protein n=1 Tax=Mucilaginibacter phyllosphaerae TaxID=1812349 RepID=A0A4Y8AJP5_9SPHI|nr:hypothetical protein [Mucilaginibacter phyllosphaerae]MBB3967695.1 hypothetical protein [Mucilaginibacter phyllosphaerae]TEW69250.1 hypothetical protein E2R65_03540 [Mucilaginibacter phyllosphaerae]GGH03928.1 hypothetical protein GCM10007352_06840 [Mucilaginibacter phyllosphaerae]
MIIYNKLWLNNKTVVDHLKADPIAGHITKEEFTKIRAAYPVGFYIPGLLVSAGLFILTCIIAMVAIGLLSLMTAATHIIESPGWPIFLGVICYVILELLTKDKHYFHSGVDNALLYYSAGLLGGGLLWIISKSNITTGDNLLSAIVICLLCIYLTLRFADVVTAAVAAVSAFASVYFFWAMMGTIGLATMPFVMMIAAAAMYYTFNKLNHLYYINCISIIKILSLITLYAAGNYYVVNSLNNILNHLDDSHIYVPYGFIFWIWTMLLPVAYVVLGLKKKNTMLLRTGLILAGASVVTFRNYYHLLPIEVMLTLSGLILLAASYITIKRLKTPLNGITFAPPEQAGTPESLNLEGLIIGQAASHLAPAAPGPSSPFGGGSGGGSGSSDSF